MFEQIIKLIEKHDSIVIFGHLNPDGDCFGSSVALKNAIMLKYPHKKVYITGSGLPRYFHLLGSVDEVSDETIANSLAIIVDSSDLQRLEDQRAYNAKEFLKIDHHVDKGLFKEGPSVVVEGATSTCDIIVDMIRDYNFPMNETIANALYLGIMTDSGHFQHMLDYYDTFEKVTYLCKCGANPKIVNSIIVKTTEKNIRGRGFIYSNYKKGRGILYLVLTKEEIKETGLTADELSLMINLLTNIEGYPAVASFMEYENGRVRVEMRSSGPKVQPICLRIGGGGHMTAAGAQLPTFDLNQINGLLKELEDEVSRYLKEGE